jgi:translation initiation factor 5
MNVIQIDDPNYRYKMPKLIAKVEGKGPVGVKTVIPNMAELALALHRHPAEVINQSTY